MVNKVNEYSSYNRYDKPSYKLNDPDLYIFATKTLVDICAKYIQYAFWCKAKISINKGRTGSDLHRASFRATLTSLQNDAASDKQNVLCKIYNVNKTDDSVTVDTAAVYDGHYSMVATVIDDSVYYLPMTEIYRYQEEMGNSCVSKDGKFMYINADYFIDYSAGSYKMEQTDIDRYYKDYRKYVLKESKSITESNKFNFNKVVKDRLK